MAACSAPIAAAVQARGQRAAALVRVSGWRGRCVSGVVRCSAGPGGAGISAKLATLWEAARGAPPVAVLAGAAAAAAIFKVASGLLAPPRRREEPVEAPPPAPEPVEVGEITEEELRQYDGSDPERPLFMAIKGQIYDVSLGRMFYGPGGPYALFAGKDASRALAKMSFEPQDLTGDISGLRPYELSALQDWEYKFNSKYVKVGTIRKTVAVQNGDVSTSSEIQEEAAKAVVDFNDDKAP